MTVFSFDSLKIPLQLDRTKNYVTENKNIMNIIYIYNIAYMYIRHMNISKGRHHIIIPLSKVKAALTTSYASQPRRHHMRLQKLAQLLGSLYITEGSVGRVFAQHYNSECLIPVQHKSFFFFFFFLRMLKS